MTMTGPRHHQPVLIRQAELSGGMVADVRMRGGVIAEIGYFAPDPGDIVLEAAGGLLLPGLHDHHIHIAACAASLTSVPCGPPDVSDAGELAAALGAAGQGWLRGIGYHESVAGMIDRDWLDAAAPHRPVRVQHRSGRMWVFNSSGLDLLLASGLPPPVGLERVGARWTGRLFDEDRWMRAAMGAILPDFSAVGMDLARHGITGITEISPDNGATMAAHFAAEMARNALPQRVVLAGRPDLDQVALDPAIHLGPVKIHLHEEHLPDFDQVVAMIGAAHAALRVVAVHCVTEVELVFTLAALREAGVMRGDRIEHASVASREAVAQMASLGLVVVAQPNFVAERGDAYRAMIPQDQWGDLYRLRSLIEAGITVAGGTDAPFGRVDPWGAMAAACSRLTREGHTLSASEAIDPDQALALFLADPQDLTQKRRLEVGAPADLCLLDRPWLVARASFAADLVRSTLIAGRIVYDRIDQPPIQCSAGRDAPAR